MLKSRFYEARTSKDKAAYLRQVLAEMEEDIAHGPAPQVKGLDLGLHARETNDYFQWRCGMFYRTKLCFRDYVRRALKYYESLVID